MLSSFLRWTLCPRFLSLCLLKDGTFPHHFKSQKTQFLQLFRPLSPIASPHKPPSFSPFQGAFFAVKVPAQIPYAPPNTFSFRGHPSHTNSQSTPAHSPSHQPFQGKLTGEFLGKKTAVISQIQYFLEWIFARQSERPGEFLGRQEGEKLGFLL